jgi:hypothetical protein
MTNIERRALGPLARIAATTFVGVGIAFSSVGLAAADGGQNPVPAPVAPMPVQTYACAAAEESAKAADAAQLAKTAADAKATEASKLATETRTAATNGMIKHLPYEQQSVLDATATKAWNDSQAAIETARTATDNSNAANIKAAELKSCAPVGPYSIPALAPVGVLPPAVAALAPLVPALVPIVPAVPAAIPATVPGDIPGVGGLGNQTDAPVSGLGSAKAGVDTPAAEVVTGRNPSDVLIGATTELLRWAVGIGGILLVVLGTQWALVRRRALATGEAPSADWLGVVRSWIGRRG